MAMPALCGSTTADGRFPADFLPLLLWAEDANDLEFLTAYVSEAGYEHPAARIQFRGMTVQPATEADFQQWRRTGQQNVVVDDVFRSVPPNASRRELALSSPASASHVAFGAVTCSGILRLPVPDKFRARVGAQWSHAKPRYWLPANTELFHELSVAAVFERTNSYEAFLRGRSAGIGMLRRDGRGTMFDAVAKQASRIAAEARPLDTYPYLTSRSFPSARAGQFELPMSWVRFSLEETAPRGQMHCFRVAQTVRRSDGSLPWFTGVRVQLAGEQEMIFRLPAASALPIQGFAMFERDEFFLTGTVISLATAAGELQ
jgi:hypothetical protein